MRFTAAFIALAAPFLVLGAPLRRQALAADILVFKFAHVLEQLETEFYAQALQKFQTGDFDSAGFTSSQIPIQLFTDISNDESTHTTVLASAIQALGDQPITNCQFDFSSVLTDVPTMAATARVVENVGVGAYLGGATLLTDPQLLVSAGTILTVEARHQTVLNILNGGSAIPSAFDIALSPPEVLAIAGGFISGCETGITANPSLSVTNTGTIGPGTQLNFQSSALNGSTSGLFCQMIVGGQPFSLPFPADQCIVPDGINGPVAVFITSDGQPLENDVVTRATSQLVAGPLLTFIDTQTEMIDMVVRAGSGSGSSSSNSGSSSDNSSGSGTDSASVSVSTQTISPQDAQSIIQSASATASGAGASETGSASSNNSGSSSSSNGGPGPNEYVGPSPDGKETVNGWTTVPAGSVTASSTSSASSSSASSSSASSSSASSSASASPSGN